jgi:hypothetical protein
VALPIIESLCEGDSRMHIIQLKKTTVVTSLLALIAIGKFLVVVVFSSDFSLT